MSDSTNSHVEIGGKNYKKIDYLDEDKPLAQQRWCCVSFLSPEGIMNCKLRGIKIRGVFGTKEEADERAKFLHDIDPDFHVFVGEVGKWLPWDPEPDDNSKVKDQVYYEDTLQKLMENYKKNRVKAQKTQEVRKQQQLEEARQRAQQERKQSHNDRRSGTIDRMRRTLAEKKRKEAEAGKIEFQTDPHTEKYTQSESSTTTNASLTGSQIVQLENNIKEKEELAKEERARLRNNQEVLQEKNQKIQSIEDQMKKIKQLYDQKKAQNQAPSSR